MKFAISLRFKINVKQVQIRQIAFHSFTKLLPLFSENQNFLNYKKIYRNKYLEIWEKGKFWFMAYKIARNPYYYLSRNFFIIIILFLKIFNLFFKKKSYFRLLFESKSDFGLLTIKFIFFYNVSIFSLFKVSFLRNLIWWIRFTKYVANHLPIFKINNL